MQRQFLSVKRHSPTHLYSAEQSQALDRLAIEHFGIPSYLLMKRAAFYSWQQIKTHFADSDRLIVLCGSGNNGGDGFMLAQYAKLAGKEVELYLYGSADKIRHDALLAYQEWREIGGQVHNLADLEPTQIAANWLLIDALFGTGLDRPLSSELCQLLQKLTQTAAPICALDVPSGLNANSGQIMGFAMPAQLTCSFISEKFGFYCNQGPDTCGRLTYSDLGLRQDAPEIFQQISPLANSQGFEFWKKRLPKRANNAHKGTLGTALLIGGNHTMMGAIQLAAKAALESGCGLCKVITQAEHSTAITAQQPEVMSYNNSALSPLLATATAIAIGPGLGTDDWAQRLWQTTSQAPISLVIDADALNILAKNSNWQARQNVVFTPHPGEAARLLGISIEEVQNDRIAAIKALQSKYGGTFVLKGNGSLIYNGKQMELCTDGNPGMARGGMGDVLTGTIVSLLAQGMETFEAACLGVYLHANAGDTLAQKKGLAGVIPSQLSQFYGPLLNDA